MLYFVYGSLKTRVKKQVSIIIDSIFKDEEKNVVELDFNECDIFSSEDYNLQLSEAEFDEYSNNEEKLFGILIKKNSQEFLIGKTDVCNCSVTASFKEFKKIDGEFYKKIKEIIDSKIIY